MPQINVLAGAGDVRVIEWDKKHLFDWNYEKKHDYIVREDSSCHMKRSGGNAQIVVHGKWHEVKNVDNFWNIECLPNGEIQCDMKHSGVGSTGMGMGMANNLANSYNDYRDGKITDANREAMKTLESLLAHARAFRVSDEYRERERLVVDLMGKICAGKLSDFGDKLPLLRRLGFEGIPMWCRDKDQWNRFQADCRSLGGTVILLGSSSRGFSMNPSKDFKLWRAPHEADPSDVDLAVVDMRILRSYAWEEARKISQEARDSGGKDIRTIASRHLSAFKNRNYPFIAKDVFYESFAEGKTYKALGEKWTNEVGAQFSFKLQLDDGICSNPYLIKIQ